MTSVYLILFIVKIYLFNMLTKVETQVPDDTRNCHINTSCHEVAFEVYSKINLERDQIYGDLNHDLALIQGMSDSALKWAQTEPENWNYDEHQCNYLQQGVSYWEKTDEKAYIEVPYDAIIQNLMHTHNPTYTCGVGALFDHDKMKNVKHAGVGVWANPKNNTRGTGKVKGVQIWIFVLYSLPPSFVPPIIHTVTPPPDPDATTGPSTTAKPISTTTTVKPSSTTAPPSTTKSASTTTAKPTSKTTPKPTTTTTTTKPTTKKSTSKPAPKTTPNPASKPTNPPKKTKKPYDQTTEPDTVLTETPEPVETTVLTTENPNDTSSEKIDPNQE